MNKQFLSKTLSIILAFSFGLSGSVMLMPLKVEATSIQLFNEDFGTSTFSRWIKSNWNNPDKSSECGNDKVAVVTNSPTGQGYIKLKNSETISTENYENIKLSFYYRIKEDLEPSDSVKVKWSSNGIDWNEVASYSGDHGDWIPVEIQLSGAENQTSLYIGFFSNFPYSYGKDEFWLDCVKLTGTPTCVKLTFYQDFDGDSYGNGEVYTQACSAPEGYVTDNTDCNDADGNIYQLLTGYADADGDTYTAGSSQQICSGALLPQGYIDTQNAEDCNDNSTAINPGASDSNCNGVDEDCNGTADDNYISTATSCGVGACVATGQKTCVVGAEQIHAYLEHLPLKFAMLTSLQ